MTTKVSYDDTQRALLKRLLQLYVGHGTSVEGFALVDVSTNLSLSRAETEALVETLVSEGYLYSTIDDEHHQITCDEMPSDEELSSLAASQGRQWSAPSAIAPSRQQLAPWLRRELIYLVATTRTPYLSRSAAARRRRAGAWRFVVVPPLPRRRGDTGAGASRRRACDLTKKIYNLSRERLPWPSTVALPLAVSPQLVRRRGTPV